MKLLGFEYWSCVYRHTQVLVWPAPSQLLVADPMRLELQGQGRADKISTACGAICWGLYNKYMSCTGHNSTWQPMKPDSWGGYQPGVGAKQSQGPGHRHFFPLYLGQVPRGTASLRRFCAFFLLERNFRRSKISTTTILWRGRKEGMEGQMEGRTEGGREEEKSKEGRQEGH